MKNVLINDTITSDAGGGSGGSSGGGLTEAQVRTIARQEAQSLDVGELDVSDNPFVRLEDLISRSDTIRAEFSYGDGRLETVDYVRDDGGRYIKTIDYDAINQRVVNIVFTDSTGTIVGITPSYTTLTKNITYNSSGQIDKITYATTTM